MQDSIPARFIHINSRFAILAKQTPQAAWDLACATTPEWSHRQLAEHIIANNYATATSIVGIDQPPIDDGTDILTALHAATEAANQTAAGLTEGDLERHIVNQYGGDMTIAELLIMGITDRGLHYWDLAVSLGQPATDYLDEADAELAYNFAAGNVEDMRANKVFGPAVDVPLTASWAERLLGLTGRDPIRSQPPTTIAA